MFKVRTVVHAVKWVALVVLFGVLAYRVMFYIPSPGYEPRALHQNSSCQR